MTTESKTIKTVILYVRVCPLCGADIAVWHQNGLGQHECFDDGGAKWIILPPAYKGGSESMTQVDEELNDWVTVSLAEREITDLLNHLYAKGQQPEHILARIWADGYRTGRMDERGE